MLVRWCTGLLLAGVALGAAWWSPYTWLGFLMVCLGIAAVEWGNLGKVNPFVLVVVLVPTGLALAFDLYLYIPLFLFLPAGLMVFTRRTENVRGILWGAAGMVWLALPAALLFLVRQKFGLAFLLALLIGTALQDTAALYAGKWWGSDRPFTPQISPNKTWAGFFGNVVAMVGTFLVASLYLSWPLHKGLIAGILLSLAGQLGDLSVSGLKREAEVKDTGFLFPGHGGILDRVDGLIFNVIVFYPFCMAWSVYI